MDDIALLLLVSLKLVRVFKENIVNGYWSRTLKRRLLMLITKFEEALKKIMKRQVNESCLIFWLKMVYTLDQAPVSLTEEA